MLLPEDVARLFEGMRFLTLQNVLLDPPDPAVYVACGFPVELNSNPEELVALGYISHLYQGSTTGIDFDPKTHILLEYDLSFSSGEDGTPDGMPDGLKGMSGCAVWRLDPNKAPDPEGARVVGIQSATVPMAGKPYIKLIKVIRWEGLLAYLVTTFPELERPMNLHGIKIDRG